MKSGRISRASRVLALTAGVAAGLATTSLGVLAVGCTGDGGPKVANIKASDMPDSESWRGVYFHPVFGYLHLVENGTTIVGRWKRADQSRWGEMSGTKVGNVFHFTWKEHTYGLIGPSAELSGKGVFVYRVEETNNHKTAKLDGQFGLGEDEIGSTWNCIKQDRMEPKLESINGDNSSTGAPPAGGNWDQK